MPLHGEAFLVAQFREFYGEVIRLKAQVQRGEWVYGTAPTPADGERASEEGSPPSAVWQALLTLLERQALTARRSGGDLALAIYRQAQYAMVALADEIFLHTDWAGREAWQSNLLESKLFQSHRAGEQVFQRIDELLRDRDAVYMELGTVYLMILALGFQGRLRDRDDGPLELASYRRRLFRFLCNREPELLDGSVQLIPDAYASTLDQGTARRLPHLRRWLYGFAAVLVTWLAAGYLVWRDLVAELQPIIRSILEQGL